MKPLFNRNASAPKESRPSFVPEPDSIEQARAKQAVGELSPSRMDANPPDVVAPISVEPVPEAVTVVEKPVHQPSEEMNDRQKIFIKEWGEKDSLTKKRSIKRLKDSVVLKALLDIEGDGEILALLKAKQDQWTTNS